MKKEILAAALSAALLLTACSTSGVDSSSGQREEEHILTLSDQAVTLDGQALTQNAEGAVTLSNDIVYYHDNTGEDYGEGTQADMHTQEEADAICPPPDPDLPPPPSFGEALRTVLKQKKPR